MQTANHILAKEGILTSFSIAKRVTTKDLKKLHDKFKNAKDSQIQEILKKAILEDTEKAIQAEQIPGLIIAGMLATQEEKKKIMELTYFASLIAKKMTEKKVDKYHSCYIINAIVNMLGLSEEDFDEFHRKFSKYRNGESESDTDTDDEDTE